MQAGSPSADVALVLEGTYPYAVGGVSTWTDGLIRRLPDVRFGIVHLFAGQEPRDAAFELSPNVVWQRDLRLADDLDGVDSEALAAAVPEATLVHALSTGFAGLVGAAVKRRQRVPFLLTEHGIYWREIERGSPELETGLRIAGLDASGGNPCASRVLWVRRFQEYARTAYAVADHVTTVTAANVPDQAALGAQRVEVIPNGVEPPARTGPLHPAELARLDGSARKPASVRIGLVGRVTPLKDIHAFIRAAALVLREEPDTRFFVVGPTDDSDYAASCRRLVEHLGVGDRIHLTGRQPAALWHRHLDVVALTSRSEAEPLALLEAMAHGTPVVAPDVGGCAALIEGDEAAGRVARTARRDSGRDIAPAVADALLALVRDPDARRAAGEAGRRRVADRTVAAMASRYGAIYEGLRGRGSFPGARGID